MEVPLVEAAASDWRRRSPRGRTSVVGGCIVGLTVALVMVPLGGCSSAPKGTQLTGTQSTSTQPGGTHLTYPQWTHAVAAGQILTATIDAAGRVTGHFVAGRTYSTQIPVGVDQQSLMADLLTHHVSVQHTP